MNVKANSVFQNDNAEIVHNNKITKCIDVVGMFQGRMIG